jgi:hypothetical protein
MSSSSSPLAVGFQDPPSTSAGYFGNVSVCTPSCRLFHEPHIHLFHNLKNSDGGISAEALSRHEMLSYDVHFMKEDIKCVIHTSNKFSDSCA